MKLFTRKAASVAALSVLVVTAGGIAYAESSLGTTSGSAPSTAAAAATSTRSGTAAASTPDRAKGLRGRALHGEFVVSTRKGFATLVLARGTVASVSSGSIS